MKIKYFFMMLASALLLSNCSQDEEATQNVQGKTNKLTATIEGASRSAVTDHGVFSWTDGDAISVWNGTGFTTFTFGEGDVFTATESITPSGVAIYPANEAHTYDNQTAGVKLATEYAYGSTNAPLLAQVNGANLTFKHLGGLMRFVVKDVPATATSFKFTTNSRITGSFAVTENSENENIISTDSESGNAVTIEFESGDITNPMLFYVPLPVGVYGGYTIEIDGKTHTTAETVENTINRGSLLLMPTFTYTAGGLVKGDDNLIVFNGGEEAELDVQDGELLTVSVAQGATATLNLVAPENTTETLGITDGSENDATSSQESQGTLNICTNASSLNINTPTLTVNLTGESYNQIVAKTAAQTLVIGNDMEIGELILNGGNLKLEGDLIIKKPLTINIATTIDLNGHTLSYESNVQGEAMITNKGNLTIIDSSTDKTGEISFIYAGEPDTSYGKGNYTIVNNGTLTVNAGTISAIGKGKTAYEKISHALYVLQNAGTLTVNGGKIYNPNNVAVRLWAGSETVASTLNLNGGEIEGLRAVWIQLPSSDASKAPLANVKVTDGTLTSWANDTDKNVDSMNKLAIYSYSYGNSMKNVNIEISGGTFNGDIALTGGSNKNLIETLKILGGTFNGLWGDVYSYGDVEKAKETITITGGLFSSLDPMQYLNGENEKVTLAKDITIASESTYLKFNGVGTLDLNGKTITGTDNSTKNFSLIDNVGTLTVTGGGKLTCTATTNSGWNRYSAVLANNPGGTLVVKDVEIEHLGGTDMAYGIDNLTNGKGSYAVTTIDNATVKSTYRAVRQFLNGVEATNELYVKNGSVLEGSNKSIFFHDPSNKANTGKLVVEAGAQLKGDVYLYVTEGSTVWPVEVSIAAAALVGESQVLTGNVPEGYEVVLNGETYVVSETNQ